MDSPTKKKLLFLSPSVSTGKERECVVQDFESISNKAIGEGAFGQVFKVRHIQTGNLYAIKMISKRKIQKVFQNYSECSKLSKFYQFS